jgi:predicted dienelactone hydrolase
MRALPGGQQFESAISQTADGGQVDSPERCEPAAKQIIEWLAEDRENRDAQQRLPIERPSTRRSLNMARPGLPLLVISGGRPG